MVIFSSVDQRLQNNCFLATWSHHGRAIALLQPLRVLHVPLYNHGLRFSVGGKSDLPRKGEFLNLETCLDKPGYQALCLGQYCHHCIRLSGRIEKPCPSPPGPEWFREVMCRPSYGLAPLHWSSLRTCFHPWPTNGWTHLWRSHGSWWGSEAGSHIKQDVRTGTL